MKGGVVLVVSLVLVAHLRDVESKRMSLEQIRESLQVVRKICINKVHVDPKMIDDANNGNFVPDRKLQCYYKCMMLQTKVMTKDDKIIEKVFVRNAELMLLEDLIPPVINALAHCRSVASQPLEGCELAYQLAKCYYDYDPALVFFP